MDYKSLTYPNKLSSLHDTEDSRPCVHRLLTMHAENDQH